MYAEVLVEYGVKSLDKTFTYKIPDILKDKIKIGMKVIVPFGTKKINGFVINVKEEKKCDYELKEIDSITHEYLILNEELLSMGKYLKEKTLCSLITAYQTMLPGSLKIKDKKREFQKYEVYITLNKSEEEIISYIESNKRSIRQIEILETLLIDNSILKKEIAGSSLNTLLKLNLVSVEKKEIYRLNYGIVEEPIRPSLTDDQKNAIQKIKSSFNEEKTFLIHGVTGSGKTEIYMKLVEEVINIGKAALLLVPEITLTTQIVKKFYERFGNNVAIFHSALSDGERYDEYLKIMRGEVNIIIGTRSAVFTPIKNLGIIIIDEEHSENYKQESNPRYHALDMAIWRSKWHKIPIVLGSATPSLESMARGKKGIYELIEIKKRIGNSLLPEVILVNMEEEMKKRNMIFSDILQTKIKDRLNKKEQIILLLNRRGFSTTITCQSCGYTHKCPHCDITLTYHKTSNNLRCHYCGYNVKKMEVCPDCNQNALNYFGLGTEKLENEITNFFPNAKIIRMDTDTTGKKGSHARILEDFGQGKYDILLGTQMISKGLDFPKVTLVGVVSGDASLNIPDFRSSERTFQLLNQVSGRAGRSDLKGEVIIQTFNPDNYTLNNIKDNDYETFYNHEMDIRRKLGYPPYYYLIGIKVISKDYSEASKEATKVGEFLRRNLISDFIVLGPTTANIFKINEIYRFQLIIKYKYEKNLLKVLAELDKIYVGNKLLHIEIDISPLRV